MENEENSEVVNDGYNLRKSAAILKVDNLCNNNQHRNNKDYAATVITTTTTITMQVTNHRIAKRRLARFYG